MFRTMCKAVMFANAINMTHSLQWGYCNHYRFRIVCGRMYQWILSMVFHLQMDSLWFSWWWILSKYSHFIAMKQPYSAKGVAEIFIWDVVRLHGMPRSIVSNRDPVFTSHFGQNFSGCKVQNYAWVLPIIRKPMARWKSLVAALRHTCVVLPTPNRSSGCNGCRGPNTGIIQVITLPLVWLLLRWFMVMHHQQCILMNRALHRLRR